MDNITIIIQRYKRIPHFRARKDGVGVYLEILIFITSSRTTLLFIYLTRANDIFLARSLLHEFNWNTYNGARSIYRGNWKRFGLSRYTHTQTYTHLLFHQAQCSSINKQFQKLHKSFHVRPSRITILTHANTWKHTNIPV